MNTIAIYKFIQIGFYNTHIHHWSCLCHRDTWLVRLFLVLKSFPQRLQVLGWEGRWLSMWAIMLSFLLAIFVHTLHWYAFSKSSKTSENKDSGLLKLIPLEYYISCFYCRDYKTKSIITAGCHFYLWCLEMCLWRLFLGLKVLQQNSQIWTNPSICVSTWLLIIRCYTSCKHYRQTFLLVLPIFNNHCRFKTI